MKMKLNKIKKMIIRIEVKKSKDEKKKKNVY